MKESTVAYLYTNPPQTESIALSVTYQFACFKFAHYLQIGE